MQTFDPLLQILYQRDLTTREQLLTEALRVRLVRQEITALPGKDREGQGYLFQKMKAITEEHLGFFPAGREDFAAIYEVLRDVDLIDFLLHIYKDDRTGTVAAPSFITDHVSQRISKLKPDRILITEAEKSAKGLRTLIANVPTTPITLTTESRLMQMALQLYFSHNKNVKVVRESIYTARLAEQHFDYIYCFPAFGQRIVGGQREYMTRESEGIAIENMLERLADDGFLDIIIPARVTFAGGGFKRLRETIMQNHGIESLVVLPEDSLRPYTAIRTYLLSLSATRSDAVSIGSFVANGKHATIEPQKTICLRKFAARADWRIELFLAGDDEAIHTFRDSNTPKVRMKDLAEVFRGKSVLKKDLAVGDIAVLNISDIDDGIINYNNLDTIKDAEHRVERYQLASDDVVLSSRGTALKVAVFEHQERTIIASANLIVIRPTDSVRGEYLKIFLESPIGQAMIKSFQRGTSFMNINYADVMEMEIPLLPLRQQDGLIERYKAEQQVYKQTLEKAATRWVKVKADVYSKLI